MDSPEDKYYMYAESYTFFRNDIGGYFGTSLFQIRSSKGLRNLSYLICYFMLLNVSSKFLASLGVWLIFPYPLDVSL